MIERAINRSEKAPSRKPKKRGKVLESGPSSTLLGTSMKLVTNPYQTNEKISRPSPIHFSCFALSNQIPLLLQTNFSKECCDFGVVFGNEISKLLCRHVANLKADSLSSAFECWRFSSSLCGCLKSLNDCGWRSCWRRRIVSSPPSSTTPPRTPPLYARRTRRCAPIPGCC